MMEQDEDEEAGDHFDGLGHAAAAPVHAPGNGLPDDEAIFRAWSMQLRGKPSLFLQMTAPWMKK